MTTSLIIDLAQNVSSDDSSILQSLEIWTNKGMMSSLATNPAVLGATVVLGDAIMIWFILQFKHVKFTTSYFRQKNSGWLLLICIPLVYTVCYLLGVLSDWASLPNMLEQQFVDMSHNVWGILSICVAAPVCEELMFRGAIEGRMLRDGWKPWVAIATSALCFGLIHINPAQVPFAFLIGCLFGWLRWKTGSIVPGILGHMLNNTVSCILMFFYGNDVISLKERAGDAVQPYIWAAYAVIAAVCTWAIVKKIPFERNLSESTDV